MANSASAPGADDYSPASKQAADLHAFLAVKNPRVSTQLAEAVIDELSPAWREPVKNVAGRLQLVLKKFGVRLKRAAALEAAARIQGHASWHATPIERREGPAHAVHGVPSRPRQSAGVHAVDDPAVVEVLDRSTGEYVWHCDVIGDDWEKALQLRMNVQTELETNPRFLCSQCMTPVYLVSQADCKKLFFRHTLEDGRCSAVTRGLLSQDEINARKYNGVKESWLHIEMKRWLVDCLRADGRFSPPAVEKRWTGEFTGAWRKPDVCSTYNGIPVAFEIQLSTTYINVIAQRRDFYRKEGGLLFWVFAQFNDGARRLTQDDVFYNNNRNAFVVNAQTREASLSQKKFMLECVWAAPELGARDEQLYRKLVPFDELTLDQRAQRAFYFDFDGARERWVQSVETQRQQHLKNLRDKFEAWFIDYVTGRVLDPVTWQELRSECEEVGVDLPEYQQQLPKGLLKALYSAKYGKVIGWDYPSFIQIAHHIEPGQRHHLHYFRKALKAYDRGGLIVQQDQSGKWKAKVKDYISRMEADDPAYEPDTSPDALVELLFPEVMAADLALGKAKPKTPA